MVPNRYNTGPYDSFSPFDSWWPWYPPGPYDTYYDPGFYEPPILGINPAYPNRLGGPPVQVSLYGSDGVTGLYGGGGLSSARNSGYQVSDSAGAITGQLPGFHASSAGGGINATADGTKIIGYNGNQRLIFNLNFGYARTNTDYGTSALTPGVSNAATIKGDYYTLTTSALYTHESYYFGGNASFDWSRDDIVNNLNNATGNTNGHGYSLGATAGDWLRLYSTGRANSPAIPTKAPPATAASGVSLYLNLAGNVNYRNERNNGFTDTSGFVYGTEQVAYTDLGARARLVAVVPNGAFAWMPFVGVSVDKELGFNHTFDIPTQAASAADTLVIGQSTTFWGAQAGLNILSRSGITAGLNAFYTASADTNVVGGDVFLKIQFYQDPPAATDGGIRAVKK
jgi:hypothetical protein